MTHLGYVLAGYLLTAAVLGGYILRLRSRRRELARAGTGAGAGGGTSGGSTVVDGPSGSAADPTT